jgi:hypothetical protein
MPACAAFAAFLSQAVRDLLTSVAIVVLLTMAAAAAAETVVVPMFFHDRFLVDGLLAAGRGATGLYAPLALGAAATSSSIA